MQSDAERTLSNLHVLGALSHNDKLLTNDDVFDIYQPTALRGLLRFWYGERRAQNAMHIRHHVHAAMGYCRQSLEDADALGDAINAAQAPESMRIRMDTAAMQHFRMLDALLRACNGLRNLLQTYRDDAAFSSQLALVVAEVEDFVRIISSHSAELRRRCVAFAVPAGDLYKSLPP